MYGPMGPVGFDVFSLLLPTILIGGVVYLALVLAQRKSPSPAGGEAPTAGPYQGAGYLVFAALYTVALAALLAAFVGFGIEAAYPSPAFPEDPYSSGMIGPGSPGEQPSPEFIQAEQRFQTEMEIYQQRLSDHHRIASTIALVAAVLMLLAGLLPRVGRLPVIGSGVTLGGVLTLLYGIVLAVQTQSELLRFIAVTVGLVALLVAIYLKFRPGRMTTS